MTCLVTAVSAVPVGPLLAVAAVPPPLFSFTRTNAIDHDGDDEDRPAGQVDPLALLGAALRLPLRRDARAPVAVLLRPAGFAHGHIVGGFARVLVAFKLRETSG